MKSAEGQRATRLYAFPYGGAGASCYRTWLDLVPPHLKLESVQFPGRENRFRDPLLSSVSDLAKDFLNQHPNVGDDPFAFFGHSLGALVAFELARELRRRGMPPAVLLSVSGYPAPHLPRSRPRVSHLAQEPFFAALRRDFHVASEILDQPQLADMVYPALRADFEAVETYRFQTEEPLDSPILAFGGLQDPEASEEQIRAWNQHSSFPMPPRFFAGGHFYLHSSKGDIIAAIVAALGLHIDRRCGGMR